LKLGTEFEPLLFALGQPSSRSGRSYRYCVSGNLRATVSAVFTSGARVGMWATNAHGYSVGAVRPGQPARRLRNRAKAIGGGLWVSPRHKSGSRYVYAVHAGRIRVVAFASRSLSGNLRGLRAAVRASGLS
jgi:hypothetical protein